MQHADATPAGSPAPAFWPTVLGLGLVIFLGFFVLGLGLAAPIAYGFGAVAFWSAAKAERHPDWYGFYRGLALGLSMWFLLSVVFVVGLMARRGDDDHSSFSAPPHSVATSVAGPR